MQEHGAGAGAEELVQLFAVQDALVVRQVLDLDRALQLLQRHRLLGLLQVDRIGVEVVGVEGAGYDHLDDQVLLHGVGLVVDVVRVAVVVVGGQHAAARLQLHLSVALDAEGLEAGLELCLQRFHLSVHF